MKRTNVSSEETQLCAVTNLRSFDRRFTSRRNPLDRRRTRVDIYLTKKSSSMEASLIYQLLLIRQAISPDYVAVEIA